jgi:hypothetical protein
MRANRVYRPVAGIAVAAALVAAGVQVADAVTGTSVPTYTGCLATSGSTQGKLFAIAVGSSPKRSCTSSETLVQLSSGDITSIAGGQAVKVTSTSLGLPDTNGEVSLDLAPQYKLPQGCTDGQLPKKSGGTWGCQTQLGQAYVGYTADARRIIGDDMSVLGDGMDLPAGSYTLSAKLNLHADHSADAIFADCRLDATGSPGIDFSRFTFYEVQTSAVVSLAGAVTKAAPFRVSVVCEDNGVGSEYSQLRIVATPVSGFTKTNLGD